MEQGKGITPEQQRTAEQQIAARFCQGVGAGGAQILDMSKAQRLFGEVIARVQALPLPTEIGCEDGRPALATTTETLENIKHATDDLNEALFEGYKEHVLSELKMAGIDFILATTLTRIMTDTVETRKVRVIW